MRPKLTALFAATAVVATLAGAAQAKPSLSSVDHVREGLITAGMAIEIGDECSTISVRMLRGLAYLNGLRDHARGLGYSNAEIDAYVDNRAEQDRLEAIARQRLAALGVQSGQESTYCAVGQAEMAQNTRLGRLLR